MAMGPVSRHNLVTAPVFYATQVDLVIFSIRFLDITS